MAAIPGVRRGIREAMLSTMLVAVGFALTVAIRLSLFDDRSGDMRDCLLKWCDSIQEHGLAQSSNAPSIYIFLPNDERWFGRFGLWFATAAIFMLVLACISTRTRTTAALTIRQATTLACVTPFLLPRMHERYVFLGDVLCLLYAFLWPRHFWVALLVIGASFSCYFKFLFQSLPVPLSIAALMLGTACVFLVFDLLRTMYPVAFGAKPATPHDLRHGAWWSIE